MFILNEVYSHSRFTKKEVTEMQTSGYSSILLDNIIMHNGAYSNTETCHFYLIALLELLTVLLEYIDLFLKRFHT